MKKVLLVEDDIRVAKTIRDLLLSSGFSVFWSQTLKDATKMYLENRQDLDLILLDGFLGPSHFGVDCDNTTIPLIIQIKKDGMLFKGKTVAMSTSPKMREEMVKAGCDFECRKGAIIEFVCNMFNFK